MKKSLIAILIFFICSISYSQVKLPPFPHLSTKFSSEKEPSVSSEFTTFSIGLGVFVYMINPIVLYENKRIYAGVTKELSLGFGKFGEHRFAFEYSFIFAGNISNHFRFSYKYDLLLKNNIKPSHELQGTSVLSFGAGYFTNLSKHGVFPELTLGYSIRNDKLLIYPHIKIRHTFMFKKQDPDITDLSFGVILGFANPFIDVNIKRND